MLGNIDFMWTKRSFNTIKYFAIHASVVSLGGFFQTRIELIGYVLNGKSGHGVNLQRNQYGLIVVSCSDQIKGQYRPIAAIYSGTSPQILLGKFPFSVTCQSSRSIFLPQRRHHLIQLLVQHFVEPFALVGVPVVQLVDPVHGLADVTDDAGGDLLVGLVAP